MIYVIICDRLWENRLPAIIFQNVVAAHEDHIVDDTLTQRGFVSRIRIATYFLIIRPNLKNYNRQVTISYYQ